VELTASTAAKLMNNERIRSVDITYVNDA